MSRGRGRRVLSERSLSIPQIADDCSDSIFHGYLLRNDHIAFVDNVHSLDPLLLYAADRVQAQMSPVWKARVGYEERVYIRAVANGHREAWTMESGAAFISVRSREDLEDLEDLEGQSCTHYSDRNDPTLVLAIEANLHRIPGHWARLKITWLHKRYWHVHTTREYDGDERTCSAPLELLNAYLCKIPDRWVSTASEHELRSKLTMLVRVAREWHQCTTMLDTESVE